MRKHVSRGIPAKKTVSIRLGEGVSRNRIQLSFESGRQTCLWQTDKSRTVVIKH